MVGADISYGYFNGSIDEVRIWSVALPSATISQWFNKPATTQHPNRPALLRYWNFDDISGSTVNDASGNNNTGTINNAPQVIASAVPLTCAAAALNFDGINDYVSISNPFTAFNKEITVEWSVNLDPVSQTTGVGIGQSLPGIDDPYTGIPSMVWLMHHYQGSFEFYISDNGTWKKASASVPAGWHRFVGVANATSIKIYMDGNLIQTNPSGVNGSILNIPNSVIHFGKDVRYNSGRFMKGSIDEVRIWNRALCQGEIQNNNSCELPGPQPGLQGYYRFNEGLVNADNSSIITLPDLSGNNRHGTLNNFALNGATSNWVAGTITGTCAAFNSPAATISPSGPTTFCQGGSVTLTASSGAAYLWSTGATTQSIIVSTAGSYTVTVTQANGCSGTSSPTVVAYTTGTNTDGDSMPDVCDPDDDNDGVPDANDCEPLNPAVGAAKTWYRDADGDSYGNPASPVVQCTQPAGFAANNTDCDDTKPTVNPAAAEICGNGIDDNCNGTTDEGCVFANALHFDGANDYVSVPAGLPAPLGDFTVEGWIKPSTTGGVFRSILNWDNWTTGALHLQIYPDGRLEFALNGVGNYYSPSPVPVNAWTHFAVVYSTTNDVIRMYINGSQVVSVPYYGSLALSGNQPFRIGSWTNDRYYAGMIDELRIWNYERSQAQIQNFMFCDVPQQSGLLRYFRFNEGVASGNNTALYSAYDYSGSQTCAPLMNFAKTGTSSNYVTGNVTSCVTIPVPVPPAEICGNGQDDDCDGLIDENCAPATGLDFDGINDYVQSAANIPITGNAARTIELWVNFKSLPANGNINALVNWGTSPAANSSITALGVVNNRFGFFGNNNDVTGSTVIQTGQWYHLAMTYDGNVMLLYVNGVPDATKTFTTPLASTSSPLRIGKYDLTGAWNTYTSMIVDEVRVWDRAFCQGLIMHNMSCEVAGNHQGLVAYYRMNQGFVNGDNTSIATVTDAGPNANNGTLYNFAKTGATSNWTTGTVSGVCSQFAFPTVSVTASGPTTFCPGGSVVFTATGGTSYKWSTGASTASITVTQPGTYSVSSVVDGCTSQPQSVTVSYTTGTDTDGDGIPDACDADDDNDGITDVAECNSSNFYWSNPPAESGNTATGVINGINYTYTSSQTVLTSPSVYAHSTFPVQYNIPNIKCIRNIYSSSNTLTFSSPISNPVLVFASIGQGGVPVPIEFSAPIDILWSTNVVKNSATRMTGTEGYAVVRLNGIFSSISFDYLATENWVNFLFGADFQSCGDTDNDGTLDYLDTDSDNDGCPDAIEGSLSPSLSQTLNGRLTGGIDAAGIPLIVNGGQGIGTSKNANVSCFCQPELDETAPQITCPGNTTIPACEGVVPNFTTSAVVSDNSCSVSSVTVTQSPAPGTAIAPGTTVSVTLTATDAGGNSTSCSFNVTRPNVTPVANNDATTLCAGTSVTFNVLGNDSHPQGAALTVNDFTLPANGTLVKNPDNTFTYTAPANASGPVTFTYTIKANDGTQAFAGNGHYYEWVPAPSITWTNARLAASQRTFNGLQGYLVTITSAAEMSFIATKLQGSGWLGASDLAYEGTWRWVTGPEGLENGGLGRHFSNQFKGGGNCSAAQAPGINGNYANWSAGEPNDCGAYLNQYSPTDPNRGGEHWAHFTGLAGFWNDFPNNAGGNIQGYVTEYGGLEACIPQLTATATVTINVNPKPVITVSGNNTICAGASTTLNAAGASTYTWSPATGLSSTTGATVTASPAATTTYTVTGTDANLCVNSSAVTVLVNTTPVIVCPANVSVRAAAGQCGANVSFGNASATGTPAPVVTYSHASGSYFNVGTTTVTVTAVNDCGTASCTFTVTVTDDQPPAITCPSDISVIATSANGAVVNYTAPVGTDNCGGATTTLESGYASGSTFPLGTTPVKYKVTDA
ncbi:MAG TPA: LamG-like jellyroll fold domain-containing protein, partial [Chitinophagaceae bacterium]